MPVSLCALSSSKQSLFCSGAVHSSPSGFQVHSALLVLRSFLPWQVVRNPGSWNGFLWSVPSPSLSLGRRLEGKILPLCKKSTSLMALTVCDASFPVCLLPRIKAASKTSMMTLEVYLTQGDGPITFLSGSFH